MARKAELGTLPIPAAYGTAKLAILLHQVAELIGNDLGLEAACLDMGGWDLHSGMGTWETGAMRNQLARLSSLLAAFYDEISGYGHRVTVVVMSEFGRRVVENDSGGTDHGKGGAMMVLGGTVNGGIYGTWPGLSTLDEGDVPITTDYRLVLAELIDRKLGNGENLDVIFPDLELVDYLGLFA